MTARNAERRRRRADARARDHRPSQGEYPGAGIVLDFGNDWELLVAVILSAQCTDKMVNQVTAELFKKYRTVEDYASADPVEFEADIRPTGFFRNKTKHIIGAAQKVLADYGGEIPASMAGPAHPAGSGAQDGQRRAGQRPPRGLRGGPGRGHRGRHARQPAEPEAGSGHLERLRQDRARADGDRARGKTGST